MQMKSSMTFIQSNGWTEIDLILKQIWRRFIWRQVSFKVHWKQTSFFKSQKKKISQNSLSFMYLLALFRSLTNSADCWCRISEFRESFSSAMTSSWTRDFSFFSLFSALARSTAMSAVSCDLSSAKVMEGVESLSGDCNIELLHN